MTKMGGASGNGNKSSGTKYRMQYILVYYISKKRKRERKKKYGRIRSSFLSSQLHNKWFIMIPLLGINIKGYNSFIVVIHQRTLLLHQF